jgi:hypothetical protein
MRKPLPLSEEAADLLRYERQLDASSPEQRRRVLARARLAERMTAAQLPRKRSTGPYVFGGVMALGLGVAAYAAMSQGAKLTHRAANQETPAERPLEPAASFEPAAREPLPSSAGGAAPRDVVAPAVNTPKHPAARAPAGPNDDQGGNAVDQELALLARAKAAVAKGNYTTALTTIDEHTRRFPKGRLREEREALRVTALWNSGQQARARRAAARFAESFPRSVLSAQMAAKANAKP